MKIYKFLCACMCSAVLMSCNDWLTVEPSTEMDRDDLFRNEAGFADAMSGIYSNMTDNSLYGKTLTWHTLELMGGGSKTIYTGTSHNYQKFSFHPESAYYSDSDRRLIVDNIWNKMYNTIANVNSMLECIDDKKGVFEGNDYEVFKGEALGLRGFLHFELLRLFSDAPNSADYSAEKKYIPYVSSLTSNVYPLLTVEQFVQLLLIDLQNAKELLKHDPMYTGSLPSAYVCDEVSGNVSMRLKYGVADWHNRRFHFNYYAVVATMARVYLWMGDKQNALACAKEVIEASEGTFVWTNPELLANVASTSALVARDRVFSTEQVFALNIIDMPDRMDGYMCQQEKSFATNTGNIVAMNTDCFDAATQSSDPRYAYLRSSYSVFGTVIDVCNKYYKDDDPSKYSTWAANRLPLIRISEMYYIAAECEPNLPTAVEYLEKVRRNRGMAAYPLECSTRNDLQKEIESEYRKEFIAEGQTFYYYKRTNQTITNVTNGAPVTVEPSLFTMPRPEDEDMYGDRKNEIIINTETSK